MTGQVTFGDLLEEARRHLDQAGGVPGRPEGNRDLLDVTRCLHAVVTAVGRYVQDRTSGEGPVMYRSGHRGRHGQRVPAGAPGCGGRCPAAAAPGRQG